MYISTHIDNIASYMHGSILYKNINNFNTTKSTLLDKNVLRYNLRAPIFQKFPGGACPQTPLAGACYAC